MDSPKKRRESFGGISTSFGDAGDKLLRESPTRFLDKLRGLTSPRGSVSPVLLSPSNSFRKTGSGDFSLRSSPSRTSFSAKTSPRGALNFTFEAEDTVLHEMIGQGGTARVYRGTMFGGFSMAIKVCQALDEESRDLMEREIELISGLQHINILGLLGWAELARKQEYFLYMELCAETLRDLLNKRHNLKVPLNTVEVKEYLVQIANGLKFLHELEDPIIHCDIKSHNVFVSPLRDHEVPLLKIGDFGESVRISEKKRPNVGTTEFRAPEIFSKKFDDPIEYNTSADIWSLGMTLYELLTLRVPYRTGSYNQRSNLVERIATGSRPRGLEDLDELKVFLELFEDCTAKAPEMRPTARAVIVELRKII